MSRERLVEQERRWQDKPVLRAVYNDLYRRMAAHCPPGRVLEVGGGSGNFKAFMPNVLSTDLTHLPWLDVVADAQRLPFADGAFSAIVLFDVLHHIQWPRRFLAEAERVLQPQGRLVMVEPGVTPVSRLFYGLFHPEPVILSADPLADGDIDPGKAAFAANQAIPHLLFRRNRQAFAARFPGLALRQVQHVSLFSYPLSGGFRPWSLLPAFLVPGILRLEDWLMPLLGPLMAFRMLVVVERRAHPEGRGT